MLENERSMVQEIDALILDTLRKKMEIKKDKADMLPEGEIETIINKVNEKMEVIALLFQGDFSLNERILEEKMELGRSNLNYYDKIANNIISKRLEATMQKVETLKPLNGRVISVCMDRKLFIEKVLKDNISLDFAKKHIQFEEIER